MNAPACRVRSVRLRAADDALVRRGAILLEDALRTASLPEANGAQLLLVRSLDLGTIRSTGSSASLALEIERAWQGIAASARHALAPGAEVAPAVFFRDDVEPYVALAVRLASGRRAGEWFWPLAVRGFSPELGPGDALRFLLVAVLDTSAGVAAAVRLLREFLDRGVADVLLRALRVDDGPSLLRGFGRSQAPGARATTATPSSVTDPSGERVLARWARSWGPDDPRSIWLACALILIRNPARHLDPDLEARALGWLRTVRAPGDSRAGESPAPQDVTASGDDAPPTPPMSTALSTGPQDASESALPLWLTTARRTPHAGLLFLIPLMTRLGITSLLESQPELIERGFPQKLAERVGDVLAVPFEDVARLAFRAVVEAEAQGKRAFTIEERPLAASWLRSMRRSSRLWVGRALGAIVHRPGRIAVTPTHVDVLFDHRQADIQIRRAGLDVDPGWVPWLGRVVRYHYLYGEQPDGH